ncbi:hypothetical protein [Allosphingosinicella sp.]|uniref:hypothetical protein n=1 Tax=Allosphingosinicella sp. TaxID=2823234 RepID=UPI0037844675
MEDEKMAVLTDEFSVKADKMRVLAKAGVSRGDIARFLGVRYQQVRNTLEGDKRTGYAPELEVKIRKEKVAKAQVQDDAPFRLLGVAGEPLELPADLVATVAPDGEPLYAVVTSQGLFIGSAKSMQARVQASFQ